jgi:hypothetical protein
MFWWWQLIDEENFYPKFAALSRFMEGEDRRAADMKMTPPELLINDAPTSILASQCLRNKEKALGWIYRQGDFSTTDPLGTPSMTGVTLRLNNMAAGKFNVEFWDTTAGKALTHLSVASKDGILAVGVPDFARDIAFKVRGQESGARSQKIATP